MRYSGRRKFDWLKRLQEHRTAFDIATNKQSREASVKRAGEIWDSIKVGVQRSVDE